MVMPLKSLGNTPCPERRAGGPCYFKKDKGDLRFKVCRYCGKVEYRTDEELLSEAEKI